MSPISQKVKVKRLQGPRAKPSSFPFGLLLLLVLCFLWSVCSSVIPDCAAIFLPQGLCTCCSLRLEHSCPDGHKMHSLTSFRCLLSVSISVRPSLVTLSKPATLPSHLPPSHLFISLACFSFLLSIKHVQYYLRNLFSVCLALACISSKRGRTDV